MDDAQLWEQLTHVFKTVFKADNLTLTPETIAADVPQWDSLNHIQLILAVESAFNIRFRNTEIAAFQNVGDLVAALKYHLDKSARSL